MNVRRRIIIDLMFYLGLPLLMWNYGRPYVGDYMAMFLSAFSGIAYTAFKFYREKKYNLTGIVVVCGITINLFLNIISNTALEILFNSLYLNGIFLALYLISMGVRRPMGQIYYIDYRRMYGEDQTQSAVRAKKFDKSNYFYLLTSVFAIRELTLLIVKSYLLNNVGIEGATLIILINRVISYSFVAFIAITTILIDKNWKKMLKKELGE